MSRNDREDVGFLNLPEPNPTTANYYTAGGKVINRDKYLVMHEPPTVCAKEVQNVETKITTYFVLVNSLNQMFDPKDGNSRYKNKSMWSFRRVNRSTFDLYTKFLKQNYRSLLSQAERGL